MLVALLIHIGHGLGFDAVSAADYVFVEPIKIIAARILFYLLTSLPLSKSLFFNHHVLNLLWQFGNLMILYLFAIDDLKIRLRPKRHSLIDIIFIVKDFYQVLASHFFALVNINITSLLICGEDESVVHLEGDGVFDNLSQMLTPLHIILAAIEVMANMCNLFVIALLIILFPLVKIIHVFIVFIVD